MVLLVIILIIDFGKPVTTDKIAKRIWHVVVLEGMGRNVLPESFQDLAGKNKNFSNFSEVIEMDKTKSLKIIQGMKHAPGKTW